jgi:hypothetical protein
VSKTITDLFPRRPQITVDEVPRGELFSIGKLPVIPPTDFHTVLFQFSHDGELKSRFSESQIASTAVGKKTQS